MQGSNFNSTTKHCSSRIYHQILVNQLQAWRLSTLLQSIWILPCVPEKVPAYLLICKVFFNYFLQRWLFLVCSNTNTYFRWYAKIGPEINYGESDPRSLFRGTPWTGITIRVFNCSVTASVCISMIYLDSK